jgi:hypothetical protein
MERLRRRLRDLQARYKRQPHCPPQPVPEPTIAELLRGISVTASKARKPKRAPRGATLEAIYRNEAYRKRVQVDEELRRRDARRRREAGPST